MTIRVSSTLVLISLLTACGPSSAPANTHTPTTTRPMLATASLTPTPTSVPTATSEPAATPTLAPLDLPTSVPLPTIETTSAGENYRTLTSEECGFTVNLPHDWVAVDDSSDEWYQHPMVGKCIFGLRPGNWHEIQQQSEVYLNDAPVVIVVASAPPEDVSDLVFLESEEGRWFVLGRQSFRMEAEVRYLNGNLLVKGLAAYGLTSKETYAYAGLGMVWRALLWDGGQRTALFEDTYDDEDAFDKLLSTFSFQ